MIEIVEGKGVGAGKSYYVCERLINHWRRGGTARVSESFRVNWDACKKLVRARYGLLLEDDQFREVRGEDVARLHEVTEAGTEEIPLLIILDEAQDQLNARDWNDKSKRDLFSWCCQSRHDDNDLIFVSQSAANIDKQIRRLATFTWSIRNARHHSIAGFGNTAKCIQFATLGLNDGFYFVRSMLDYDGRTVLERKWVKADKGLFKCYTSKSMALARKRAGVVAKKNLRYEKGRKPMVKYVIAVAILLGGYSAFKLTTGGNPFDVSKDSKAKTAQPAPAKTESSGGASAASAYELRSEKWFARFDEKSMKTESGLYMVGKLSGEGFVEGIQDGVIRVRRPSGRVLYIVCQDYIVPSMLAPVAEPSPTPAKIVVAEYDPNAGRVEGGASWKESYHVSPLKTAPPSIPSPLRKPLQKYMSYKIAGSCLRFGMVI